MKIAEDVAGVTVEPAKVWKNLTQMARKRNSMIKFTDENGPERVRRQGRHPVRLGFGIVPDTAECTGTAEREYGCLREWLVGRFELGEKQQPGVAADVPARGKIPAAFERRCIPRGRRCSSVEYAQYASSSRLATRAPRRSRCDAGFHHGLVPVEFGETESRLQLVERFRRRRAGPPSTSRRRPAGPSSSRGPARSERRRATGRNGSSPVVHGRRDAVHRVRTRPSSADRRSPPFPAQSPRRAGRPLRRSGHSPPRARPGRPGDGP